MTGDPQLIDFFASCGKAIATVDLKTIAASYAYPGYVVGDAQSVPITSPEEVEAFFGAAAEGYRRLGLAEARAELTRVDVLSDVIVSVDVRWSYIDATGAERASERFRYLLRRARDSVTICVAVQITATAPN